MRTQKRELVRALEETGISLRPRYAVSVTDIAAAEATDAVAAYGVCECGTEIAYMVCVSAVLRSRMVFECGTEIAYGV
eukprot:1678740-Rhodomonas_salina.1